MRARPAIFGLPARRCPGGYARTGTLAVLAAVGLAACGGSSATDDTTGPPATRTVTHTRTVSPPASASTTVATSTATPTVTHTSTREQDHAAAGTGGACVASDLQLRFLGGSGATGHGELGFALTNTTRSPCHTYGYPGVLLLDGAGQGLATNPTHTTSDFFGATRERELTVAPGASVSFRLGVTHEAAGGGSGGCTTAAGLQVIAPDDTATLRVSIPSGGAAECGGTVTVSPLQPGTSAFGG